MPVSALDTTAGGASANAYCTQAFADQYHLDRPAPSVAWSTYSSDQKNSAILWATKLLDALWEWCGWPVSNTQALAWPRSGLMNRNKNASLSTTAIPNEIQQATAEFARQLLAADRAADSDIETQGIRSITAGPVSLSFKDTVYAKVVPDAVQSLIPIEWGRIRKRGGFSPMVAW